MRKIHLLLVLFLACSGSAMAQALPKPVTEHRTISQVLDRALTMTEKEFVPAADAMPEEKFGFAPTNGEFKGVRTFAEQIKHTAAVNYEFGAAVLAEKPPVDIGEESGPPGLKTKSDIMKFLNDSFVYLHKAIASINEKNVVEPLQSPFGEGTVTRLGMTTLSIEHIGNQYGQVVEYLRMNGIVPPASRR
jgi:DinB family protein